ncbi:ABC transporter A, ABCA, partial [Kipferlia bialata]
VWNEWAATVERVFETAEDTDQWGRADCIAGEYAGMFRNVVSYYIRPHQNHNNCMKRDNGKCMNFPQMRPDPWADEYALDDFLYSQLQVTLAEYTEVELYVDKMWATEMPTLAFIVHEDSDVFQYDWDTKTYSYLPDTLVTDYTMQIASNIPVITDMDTSMKLQGESMMMVFDSLVSDLIVSKKPTHYNHRVSVMPTCHVYVSMYPVTMSSTMLISDLTFPLLAFSFSFVFVISTSGVIAEKEDKLKENMLLAGLRFTAYYTAWLIACTGTSLLVFGFCYLFGVFTAQPAYTDNGSIPWILLLVCWAVGVSGVSICFSAFFTKGKLAVFLAVILLLFQAPIYQYAMVLVGLPRSVNAWPFFLFFRQLGMLTPMGPLTERVTNQDILTPSARGVEFIIGCVVLLGEGLLYTILGGYLDNVLPSAGDTKLHPLFFLAWLIPKRSAQEVDAEDMERDAHVYGHERPPSHMLPGRLTGDSGTGVPNPVKRGRGHCYSLVDACQGEYQTDHFDTTQYSRMARPEPYEDGEDPHVTTERKRVSRLLRRGGQFPPLVIADLRKVFKGGLRQKANVAVHRTTLAVDTGTCFGLLGENGAGKSTTINLICGTLKPTSGTVFIKGGDVCALDKASLLEHLGVCPQHDRLHGELTVKEEIIFYMRLRGYSSSKAIAEAPAVIESVGLKSKADHRISDLSGGMQRRTSLAIALTGTPSVVLLDEPTSGLDPATRRELWAIIPKIKQRRAVVLTTHSMDEAEILCDSLSIVASGRLQCLGSPASLSYDHGKAYVLNFLHHNASLSDRDTAEQLVRYLRRSLSPDTMIKNTYGASTCILVPRRELSAKVVVEVVETSARRLAIQEWSLSDYSLQDVFVDVILKARAKYLGPNAHGTGQGRDIFGRPL